MSVNVSDGDNAELDDSSACNEKKSNNMVLRGFYTGHKASHVFEMKCSSCMRDLCLDDRGRCCYECEVILCEDCLPDALVSHPKPKHSTTKLESLRKIHQVAGLKPVLGCG